MSMNKKYQKEITRIAEYMVSGGVWFWSGYLIIVTLDDVMPLFYANFIGNAVGISLNFILSRYWVFKTRQQSSIETATKRYIVYTALNAFLLNYLILKQLRSIGIEPEIGQFIAAAFFTVWNYVWYKAWVFKGREKPRHVRHHTP
jgi:putative flippase GtrA